MDRYQEQISNRCKTIYQILDVLELGVFVYKYIFNHVPEYQHHT